MRREVGCAACRYIPYSIAAHGVKILLCSPWGRRYALRKSASLFRILDASGLKYDAVETAVRHTMHMRLFPWAYCRFIKCLDEELDRWVSVAGLENLTGLLNGGMGVLMLTSHFGPAYVTNCVLGAKGYTVYVLRASDRFVRRYCLTASDRRLPREIYTSQDKSPGLLKTTTTIYDLLRDGNIVASALDNGGRRGSGDVWLPLIGHMRPFRIGLLAIAARAGARIVQRFEILKTDGSIDIRFGQPFPEFRADRDRSPAEYAEEVLGVYVEGLQSFLESNPGMIQGKLTHWRKSQAPVH